MEGYFDLGFWRIWTTVSVTCKLFRVFFFFPGFVLKKKKKHSSSYLMLVLITYVYAEVLQKEAPGHFHLDLPLLWF